MESNLNIKIFEKGKVISMWPGENNAYKCIVLNSDNIKDEAVIPKAECELLMKLRILESKLTRKQISDLKNLIISFGDERYDQAIIDESIRNAGDEI